MRGAIGSLYTADVPSIVTETLMPKELGTAKTRVHNTINITKKLYDDNYWCVHLPTATCHNDSLKTYHCYLIS